MESTTSKINKRTTLCRAYTFCCKLLCDCSKEIISSNTILKSKFEVHMKHSKELATLFVFALHDLSEIWNLLVSSNGKLILVFNISSKYLYLYLLKWKKEWYKIFAGGKPCVCPLKNEIIRLPIGFRLNHLTQGWYTLEKKFSLIWAHRERKQAVNNNLNNTN